MSGAPAGEAEVILSRIEATSGRPLRAMIEISDRCNEVCVHCYQVQGQKGEMTTAQIKTVMDELAELGVLVLTISGGEATLRKDFLELLAHARGCGFAIRLFTNGLTMTRDLAHALKELAVHVVEISVYSHRAELHDFVTGVRGAFDKTIAGIRYLAAEGVDVHMKTPMMSMNEDDVDAYIALATELGATYAFDPSQMMPREDGSRAPELYNRSEDAYRRVMQDPRLAAAPMAPRPQKPLDATLCGAGELVHIEPNGEIRPCTMLSLPLGNAAEHGVREAREHGRAWRELLALRWRDVHGCRDCDLRAYCGRCHASALAEAGDALGPYASACARARTHYELAHGVGPRVTATSPAHDIALGPYRQLGDHAFTTADDVVTPDDNALAERLGWVRRAPSAAAPVTRARPGELVQIRRPGHRRASLERVPAASHAFALQDGREPALLADVGVLGSK